MIFLKNINGLKIALKIPDFRKIISKAISNINLSQFVILILYEAVSKSNRTF